VWDIQLVNIKSSDIKSISVMDLSLRTVKSIVFSSSFLLGGCYSYLKVLMMYPLCFKIDFVRIKMGVCL
jgi:hypothetical protein